jgi:sortase A
MTPSSTNLHSASSGLSHASGLSSIPAGAPPSSRRRLSEPDVLFAALLGILGLASVGQGAWIFAKAQLAQVLLERAFTESITTGQVVRPWSWADTWPVARISVPRLGAVAIALAGSSGQALAFGPGHVEGTPEAGDIGTAVYAAHRDTHFAFLQHVVAGDRIEVARRDGRVVRFRVVGTDVVAWDRSGIDAASAGVNLVLATCWPFDATTPGTERFVVHAVVDDGTPVKQGG